MKRLAALLLLLVFFAGCAAAEIPLLAQADWSQIETVTVTSDGYFGRDTDEPLILGGEEAAELVRLVQHINQYRAIPAEKTPEGLCGVFVDFGNGVVISMEPESGYGIVASEVAASGGTWYRLPNAFCRAVTELLAAQS